ncbi:hypothetical protein ABZ883_35395 [Streptomyces sp. NPDC046977]|uniref:hypothetical protein n=1 Tax=Streptomyces sp. NPDC046977 TaxID=3154703 RepID=UPI0033CFEBE6
MPSTTTDKTHRQVRRVHRGAVVAAAVVIGVFALAACAGDKDSAEPASVSKAPKSTASKVAAASPNPTAAAQDKVAAAFQGLVDAETAGFAKATFEGTGIEHYASGQVLADDKKTLLINRANGIVTQGKPAFTVTKTTVDLSVSPHRGALTVCWDDTGWTPVKKATGKSVAAPDQAQRYVVNSKLRTIGTRWVVTDSTATRDQSC